MVNILRLPQVQARTGLSRTAIYIRMKRGTFPKSIALGNSRSKGWIESEIDALIQDDIRRAREPVETRGQPAVNSTRRTTASGLKTAAQVEGLGG